MSWPDADCDPVQILKPESFDRHNTRKLVAAIFTEALEQADLLIQWTKQINEYAFKPDKLVHVYVQAISYREQVIDLRKFFRSKTAGELLEFLDIEPNMFWNKLAEKLFILNESMSNADKIIRRGPPHVVKKRKVKPCS